MSEITQFQRNHVSVLLLSTLIQHTKITLFLQKHLFNDLAIKLKCTTEFKKSFRNLFKVILYSYLILKKMSERITES